MYALTVKQPWAQAIARYGKTVENRTRRPPAHLVGQRIAIHVSQTLADVVGPKDDPRTMAMIEAGLGEYYQEHGLRVANAGRIIATARLVAWFRHAPGERLPGGIIPGRDWACVDGFTRGDCLRAVDSPWLTGPVGWVLADVRALRKPVGAPCGCLPITRYSPTETCQWCRGIAELRDAGAVPIRGQVYPFVLSAEVEATILAMEATK